jgi:predicted Fe-Mo cluster-binding NifX family protein
MDTGTVMTTPPDPRLLAIPASGEGKDRPADERFGRCSCFALFDTARGTWSFIPNPARGEEHGAGIAAARCLIDRHVDVVIGPPLGPNAADVLKEASIACYPLPEGRGGSVESVLAAWLAERDRGV